MKLFIHLFIFIVLLNNTKAQCVAENAKACNGTTFGYLKKFRIYDYKNNVIYDTANLQCIGNGKPVVMNKSKTITFLSNTNIKFEVAATDSMRKGWSGMQIWIDFNFNDSFESNEKIITGIEWQYISKFKKTFDVNFTCFNKFGLTKMRVITSNFYANSHDWISDKLKTACGKKNQHGTILDFNVLLAKETIPAPSIIVDTNLLFVNSNVVFKSANNEKYFNIKWSNNSNLVIDSGNLYNVIFSSTGSKKITVKYNYCGIVDSTVKTVSIKNPYRKPQTFISIIAKTVNASYIFYRFSDSSIYGAASYYWVVQTPFNTYTYTTRTISVNFDLYGNYSVSLTTYNYQGYSNTAVINFPLLNRSNNAYGWNEDSNQFKFIFYQFAFPPVTYDKTIFHPNPYCYPKTAIKITKFNIEDPEDYLTISNGAGFYKKISKANIDSFKNKILIVGTFNLLYSFSTQNYGIDTAIIIQNNYILDTTKPKFVLLPNDTIFANSSQCFYDTMFKNFFAVDNSDPNINSKIYYNTSNNCSSGKFFSNFKVTNHCNITGYATRVIYNDVRPLNIKTYYDKNGNCRLDAGENYLPFVNISVNGKINRSTNATGELEILSKNKSEIINATAPNNFKFSCTNTDTWRLSNFNKVVQFGLQPINKLKQIDASIAVLKKWNYFINGVWDTNHFYIQNMGEKTLNSYRVQYVSNLLSTKLQSNFPYNKINDSTIEFSLNKSLQTFEVNTIQLVLKYDSISTQKITGKVKIIVLNDSNASNDSVVYGRKIIDIPTQNSIRIDLKKDKIYNRFEKVPFSIVINRSLLSRYDSIPIYFDVSGLNNVPIKISNKDFPFLISKNSNRYTLKPQLKNLTDSAFYQINYPIVFNGEFIGANQVNHRSYIRLEAQTNIGYYTYYASKALNYSSIPKIIVKPFDTFDKCSFDYLRFTLIDSFDNEFAIKVKTSKGINFASWANDTIKYWITNTAKEVDSAVQIIVKKDIVAPTIFFNSKIIPLYQKFCVQLNSNINDSFSASDNCDKTVPVIATYGASGKVNTAVTGIYKHYYFASDSAGNASSQNGALIEYYVKDFDAASIILLTGDTICHQIYTYYQILSNVKFMIDCYDSLSLKYKAVTNLQTDVPGIYSEKITVTNPFNGKFAEKIRTIIVKDCNTANSKNYAASKIRISPNPTSNVVSIQANDKLEKIEMSNFQGAKIPITLNQISVNKVNIHFNVTSGIYFIKCHVNNKLITKKLIVE